MITEIPTEREFHEVGLSLLNLSWDGAVTLLKDLDESQDAYDEEESETQEYWAAARHPLAVALATAQQGAEFLLKSRIVAISPFLLFAGPPEKWPRGCDKQDTAFGEFRTIDALDLIRVHDTCAPDRLPSEFVAEFEALRLKRNAIMHTVDRRLSVHVEELILAILTIHSHLCRGERWTAARKRSLENSPVARLLSDDHVDAVLSWEFSLVCELLKPKEMKEFFAFNKRQRRYLCPYCNHQTMDMDVWPRTAHLVPNSASSNNLWCFVCGKNQEVYREGCSDPECPGNVLSADYGDCSTCGQHSLDGEN